MMQLVTAPEPEREHWPLLLKVPVLLVEKTTRLVSGSGVPTSVSVTVTVQDEELTTGVWQVIVVEVDRGLTVIVNRELELIP